MDESAARTCNYVSRQARSDDQKSRRWARLIFCHCDGFRRPPRLQREKRELECSAEMNPAATIDQLDAWPEQERTRAIDEFLLAATAALAPFRKGDGPLHPVSANVVMAHP